MCADERRAQAAKNLVMQERQALDARKPRVKEKLFALYLRWKARSIFTSKEIRSLRQRYKDVNEYLEQLRLDGDKGGRLNFSELKNDRYTVFLALFFAALKEKNKVRNETRHRIEVISQAPRWLELIRVRPNLRWYSNSVVLG